MEKLRSEYVIDIRITHFPLHPHTPPEGLTLEELFSGKNVDLATTRDHLIQLMAQEGLSYGDRTMTFNSRLAQELASWAQSRGNKGEIHEALFQAYFVHGINLAQVEELVRIAEQVGLPGQEAREVIESRRFRDHVDADWQRSRESGVTGVPTFVIGNRGVIGAQPYEILEKLAVRAGAPPRGGN